MREDEDTGTGGSGSFRERMGKPTARCKDGNVSYSRQREGTCSHHGGVERWF